MSRHAYTYCCNAVPKSSTKTCSFLFTGKPYYHHSEPSTRFSHSFLKTLFFVHLDHFSFQFSSGCLFNSEILCILCDVKCKRRTASQKINEWSLAIGWSTYGHQSVIQQYLNTSTPWRDKGCCYSYMFKLYGVHLEIKYLFYYMRLIYHFEIPDIYYVTSTGAIVYWNNSRLP